MKNVQGLRIYFSMVFKNHFRIVYRKPVFLLLLFLYATSFHAFAQREYDGIIALPAPEQWSFMKYGNAPTNLYTGTASVSIPIYTIKNADFTIPISLDYGTGGYMANQQTGSLGLGWSLNAGGMITREMRNLPDDCDPKVLGVDGGLNYQHEYNGYLRYYNDYLQGNQESVFNLPGTDFNGPFYYFTNNLTSRLLRCETESDIYSFKFLGHSGKFMLGLDGKIKVYSTSHPAGEYQISIQAPDGNSRVSVITIKTGDGYTYTFDSNNIRVGAFDVFSNDKGWGTYNEEGGQLTWFLTMAKAPNGQAITFDYSGKIGNSSQPILYESIRPGGFMYDGWTWHETTMGGKKLISGGSHHQDALAWGRTRTYSIEPIRISGDGFDVEFKYSRKTCEKAWAVDSEIIFNLEQVYKLDEIKITNGSSLNKTIALEYEYAPATRNPIMFLHKVDMGDEGRYEMEYYGQDSEFPYMGTTGTDHWGYYNGVDRHDLHTFLPDAIVDPETNKEYLQSNLREPDFNAARQGALKKICYPTKGYTEFEYEPHTYSSYVTQDYTNGGYPYIQDAVESVAGGIRIKQITDFSDEGTSTTRQYVYQKNGKGSGRLLNYPRYYEVMTMDNTEQAPNFWNKWGWTKKSTTNLATYHMDKTNVEYDDVREIFDDGSYCDYHYSNYKEWGDPRVGTIYKPLSPNRQWVDFGELFTTTQYNFHKKRQMSLYTQRGKLLSKKMFTNDGRPVSEEINHYDIAKSLAYTACVVQSLDRNYEFRNYVDDYPLTQTTLVNYAGNDPITTITNYTYNSHKQPTKIETVNSAGDHIRSQSQYVTDLSPTGGIFKDMQDMNFISAPIKTQTSLKRTAWGESSYSLTSAKAYEFSIQKNPGNEDMVVMTKASVVPAKNRLACNDFFFDDLLTTRATYKYNAYGRVIDVEDRTGIHTTYDWGKDGNAMYPTAKVMNAKTDVIQYDFEMVDASYEYELTFPDANAMCTDSFEITGYFNQPVEIYVEVYNSNYQLYWGSKCQLNHDNSVLGDLTETGTYCYTYLSEGPNTFYVLHNEEPFLDPGFEDLIFYIRVSTQELTPVEVHKEKNQYVHMSFEEDSFTPSVKAKMGQSICNRPYTIDLSDFGDGQYFMTYWKSSDYGDTWEMIKQIVTVDADNHSATVGSESYWIDELRIYPSFSQMTTYIYEPGLGLTAEMDPSGRIVHYRYDHLGRMTEILDDKGHPVKQYKYHVKQQ